LDGFAIFYAVVVIAVVLHRSVADANQNCKKEKKEKLPQGFTMFGQL